MITHIVAMGLNQAIGKNNKLPWHLPEDLKHFKDVTMGKTVVMGTNTFRSIVQYSKGKPILPGRTIIVISGTPTGITRLNDEIPQPEGVAYWTKPLLDIHIKSNPNIEINIVGGAQLYATYEPDKIIATHVQVDVPDADTFYHVDLTKYKVWDASAALYSSTDIEYEYITYHKLPHTQE